MLNEVPVIQVSGMSNNNNNILYITYLDIHTCKNSTEIVLVVSVKMVTYYETSSAIAFGLVQFTSTTTLAQRSYKVKAKIRNGKRVQIRGPFKRYQGQHFEHEGNENNGYRLSVC